MFRATLSNYHYLKEVFELLSRVDRKKILLLALLQFFISILDLLGLLVIGIVSSLSISIVSLVPIPDSLGFITKLPFFKSIALTNLVLILSIIAALLLISKTVISALITRKITGFLSYREAQISSSYIAYVCHSSPKWQLSKSPQYISGVALEGANSAVTISLGQVINLIVELLSMAIIFIGISTFDLSITLPSFLFFGLSSWISYKFLADKVRDAGKENYLIGISSNELIRNMVIGSRELYTSSTRDYVLELYKEQRLINFRATRARSMAAMLPKYASEVSMVVGGLLIAGFQFLIKDAHDAITSLVIFMALSSRLLPLLLRIQAAILAIRGGSEATKNFLDEYREAQINANIFQLDNFYEFGKNSNGYFEPEIVLDSVNLRHDPESQFQISDINLSIRSGEFIALTGPSGSGKSTLIDLILGIISPDSGIITISGVPPIVAMQEWPNCIRYVPQDIYLFGGTILDNIKWPDKESQLSDYELEQLLTTVELSDWIKSLPKGIHTKLNSLGSNLSGGQKQRIGIARALYSSPKILILDESTSSLDTKTEREIVYNILNKMRNITRIVIAHRITTIKNADTILLVKDGRIIAHGQFDKLWTESEDFKELAGVELLP